MNKFQEWNRISAELSYLKKEEAKLRCKICAEIFENAAHREFSAKKIIDGLEITATQKVIISVDEAIFENIFDELTDEEKSAIKFKPLIKKSIYEKLPLGLLHEAIIEKPAMPTLKIREIEK